MANMAETAELVLNHEERFDGTGDPRGLAVPGMPGGSPGMEGNRSVPYDVLLVLPDSSHRVYARYGR